MDREKVIKGLKCAIGIRGIKNCDDCPYDNDFNCLGCDIVMRDALDLIKEHEVVQPKTTAEELKQKVWNALWTEEDKCEEKYVGTGEHDSWFFIYRLWLQKGFNLAIEAIADWEGR